MKKSHHYLVLVPIVFVAANFAFAGDARSLQIPNDVTKYINATSNDPKILAAMEQVARGILFSLTVENKKDAATAQKMRFDAGRCIAQRMGPEALKVVHELQARIVSTPEAIRKEINYRNLTEVAVSGGAGPKFETCVVK